MKRSSNIKVGKIKGGKKNVGSEKVKKVTRQKRAIIKSKIVKNPPKKSQLHSPSRVSNKKTNQLAKGKQTKKNPVSHRLKNQRSNPKIKKSKSATNKKPEYGMTRSAIGKVKSENKMNIEAVKNSQPLAANLTIPVPLHSSLPSLIPTLSIPTRYQDYTPILSNRTNSIESLDNLNDRKTSTTHSNSTSDTKKNWPSWKYYIPKKTIKGNLEGQTMCRYKKVDIFDSLSRLACLKILKSSINVLGRPEGSTAQEIIDYSMDLLHHDYTSSFRNHLQKSLYEYANCGLIKSLRRGTFTNPKNENLRLRNSYRTPLSTKGLNSRTKMILEALSEASPLFFSENSTAGTQSYSIASPKKPIEVINSSFRMINKRRNLQGFFSINKKFYKPQHMKVMLDDDLLDETLMSSSNHQELPQKNIEGSNFTSKKNYITQISHKNTKSKSSITNKMNQNSKVETIPISNQPNSLAQQLSSHSKTPTATPLPKVTNLISETSQLKNDSSNMSSLPYIALDGFKKKSSPIEVSENTPGYSNYVTHQQGVDDHGFYSLTDETIGTHFRYPKPCLPHMSSKNTIEGPSHRHNLPHPRDDFSKRTRYHLPTPLDFRKRITDAFRPSSGSVVSKHQKNIGIKCALKSEATPRITSEISVHN